MRTEGNVFSVPFHWSGGMLAVTIVTLVVLVGASVMLISRNFPVSMLWLKYLLLVVFAATVIIGAGFMPIRLKADDEKVSVSRLFGLLEISRDEIIEAKQLLKSDIDNSIRTFGSGGLFGFLGRFNNDRLGNYTMYATELNNLVLIRTNDKKYVFSCSHPRELVNFINRQSGQSE